MPKQVHQKDEFVALLPKATEIRVVKKGDATKLKLRTKNALYTYVTTEEEAETLLKGNKTPTVEF